MATLDEVTTLSPEEECLRDRHWYAFLCSSFISFFAGLLLVLSGRIFSWLFCDSPVGDEPATAAAPPSKGRGADLQVDPAAQIGWATEAKDWAGELMSGQTTTGRILVSHVGYVTVVGHW